MAPAANQAASRRREQGARTRDRVLEVATDLMARHGYSGTTISAISRASGVLPASIYWHFESKEGLLGAVVERAADAWFQGAARAIEQAEADGTAPVEEQRRAGLGYVFVEQPEFYRVLLMIALERRQADDASLEAVRRIRERSKRLLAERIEPRVPIDDAALRRSVCEQLAEHGHVLLDGFFVAHQIDREGPEGVQALFDRFARAMNLARVAAIEEATGRPCPEDQR